MIYPPTSFDPDAKTRQDAALRATDAAQPAIGAVSFGAWRVLSERFGLEADAFAGHSYGELPALASAGRLTPADLFAQGLTVSFTLPTASSNVSGEPGGQRASLGARF